MLIVFVISQGLPVRQKRSYRMLYKEKGEEKERRTEEEMYKE